MKRAKNITFLLGSAGFFFGLLFPIIGTLIEMNENPMKTIVELHQTNHLLQIIDLAPFILMTCGILLARPYNRLQAASKNLMFENHIKDDTIEEVNTELERKNSYLQQLAYFMTHDLKSTLRGISSLHEFLKEEEDPGQIESYNTLMKQRITRMDMLYDSLLDFLRKSQLPTKLININHDTLIDSIQQKFDGQLKIVNQNLNTLLFLDQEKLNDIYLELIQNTLQHGQKEELKVYINAHNNGITQKIVFSDNGQGIAKEYHAKIFNFNTKLDRRDEKETTGMGLAFVQMLVNDMNGEIKILDTPNTTFELNFPSQEIN